MVGYAGRWLILDDPILLTSPSPQDGGSKVWLELMEHMLRASVMDGANRMTLKHGAQTGAQKLSRGFNFSQPATEEAYTDNNEDY